GRQRGGDGLVERGHLAVDHHCVEPLLATEVLVDHRFGHLGALGDLLDGGGLVAALGEQGPADVDQLFPALGTGHPGPPRGLSPPLSVRRRSRHRSRAPSRLACHFRPRVDPRAVSCHYLSKRRLCRAEPTGPVGDPPWCNRQHSGFWFLLSWFEPRRGSFLLGAHRHLPWPGYGGGRRAMKITRPGRDRRSG